MNFKKIIWLIVPFFALMQSIVMANTAERQLTVFSSKDNQVIEGAIIYDLKKQKAYRSNHHGIVFLDNDSTELQIKAKYHHPQRLNLNTIKGNTSSIRLIHDKNLLIKDQALIHSHENIQRGSFDPYRANNDLLSYDLTVKVEPERKYISGNNKIRFKMLKDDNVIRIDLYQNMAIEKILYHEKKLTYKRDLNAVYIQFPAQLTKGTSHEIDFYYAGTPVSKGRFGCFSFNKDDTGKHWINTACHSAGSMVWWPNKDQQPDEVNNMVMRVSVPSDLMNISNGRLIDTHIKSDGFTEYVWQILSPINNYSISLNIGNYVHFAEKLGELTLDYYVLAQDLEKAKKQFKQVKPMMSTYQKYFGEYPFNEDGYKLIQSPYTGMEHQSAITYGNGFKNGYNRGDGSSGDWTKTGISLKFDFIIIHETAHEWFGNSLTAYDVSDAWIHEGWGTYAEAVYVEEQFGYESAIKYLNGYKDKVSNKLPMIGPPSVNHWPTSDIYFKGILFINTLRHVINDDEKWWAGVKGFTTKFKKSHLYTVDVLNFFNRYFEADFERIFDQYLYHNELPTLMLSQADGELKYRWQANVKGFDMPIDVSINHKKVRLFPKTDWQVIKKVDEYVIHENLFYIQTQVQ